MPTPTALPDVHVEGEIRISMPTEKDFHNAREGSTKVYDPLNQEIIRLNIAIISQLGKIACDMQSLANSASDSKTWSTLHSGMQNKFRNAAAADESAG